MAIEPGDVFELKTEGGLSYVQAVFLHQPRPDEGLSFGWFVRVFAGIRKRRPNNKSLEKLTTGPSLYGCFLADPGALIPVGRCPLGADATNFPVFKQFNGVSPTPEGVWILWNGAEERITHRLPKIALGFPVREIVDSTILKERIEKSWTPAADVPPECVSSVDTSFSFEQFPLLSEFTASPETYGDVVGFLRSKGLIESEDSDSGVMIHGPDFSENDVADAWLKELPEAGDWDTVLNALTDFKSRQTRHADVSARAYGAIGVTVASAMSKKQASFQFPKTWGPPPLQVVREAMVVASQLGQRSGLRDAMESAGKLAAWQKLLSSYQSAVVSVMGSLTR